MWVSSSSCLTILSFLSCFGAFVEAGTDFCVARAAYKNPNTGFQVVVKGNALVFSGGTLVTQYFNISKESGYSLPLRVQKSIQLEDGVFCFDQGAYFLVLASESSREKLSIVRPFSNT